MIPPFLDERIMRFFFLLWGAALFGHIVEAPHIRQVDHYLTPDCLLILDIDDTLLIPAQMLGCDEWFSLRLKQRLDRGVSFAKALEKSLAEWEAVRHLTKMEIVEPAADLLIRNLQERGVRIMGLTTQGLALATRTSLQLLENRIDLHATAPMKEDWYFQVGHHGVLFRNGILFTSGTNKGEALFRFLDHAGIHPLRIIFLNDKKSHLMEVEKEAAKRAVDFIGMRYSYSDERKAAFRADVAAFQYLHSNFCHILSDQEALRMMTECE